MDLKRQSFEVEGKLFRRRKARDLNKSQARDLKKREDEIFSN